MLQAIVFDFDGVIADSEPLHLRAYQAVLGQDGIDLTKEDYYKRYLGYDDMGLFQALTEDRRITISTERMDSWVESKSEILEEMLSGDSILFPGVAACVRMCAERYPLAIASGALAPEIELVLEQAGLRHYFKAIASASDGVRGKPAPDLYMLAMAKLRDVRILEPNSCIAIEDSRWGLQSARLAGLRTVAVTHTYPAVELNEADFTVDRLSDLTIPGLERLVR